MLPNLVDTNKLDKLASKIIFNKNTNYLNISLFIIGLFFISLVFIFSTNFSKKKNKNKLIRKLKYIENKSSKIYNSVIKS